jgi:hypothetical protein
VHYHAIYLWLEGEGNLWKAVVAFWVAVILGWLVGVLPWLRNRKTREQIADRLNTETPGGLADLVKAINRLEKRNDEADSGSDGPGSGLRSEPPARQDGEQ